MLDHDQRSLIDHSILAKSADHAKGADIVILSIASPECAVEPQPLSDTRTFGTKVMKILPAPTAVPVCRNEGEYHVVSDRDSSHLGSNFFDNSRSLMTKDHRLHRNSALAPHRVIFAAAKANDSDADKRLRWTRRIKLDLLNRQC